MKFQPDTLDGVNVITRHDGRQIVVGRLPYAHSVLVPWVGAVRAWEVSDVASLTAAHFEPLLAMRPEVVILGSGARLRFVSPACLRLLIEARVGVETMDTAAACRTYNVLVSEGRQVVAALLLSPGPESAAGPVNL